MWVTAVREKCRCLIFLMACLGCLVALPAVAGPYRDSAHGDPERGANRAAMEGNYIEYATGNCAHCHEMHSSLQGMEPAPGGGASSHTLFAAGFNSARTQNPYSVSDAFCFFCHSDEAAQPVRNQDYSATFGGASSGSGPQSMMAAFNQTSYHNLYDILHFLKNDPVYATAFGTLDNPCIGCHNPHLAKRNGDSALPGFPLRSAISRPGNPKSLWGETETMSAFFGYEAPFAMGIDREPAGVGEQNGENTPDYVTFCTSCHSPDNAIASTALARDVKKINWGTTGLYQDKHGGLTRDGAGHFRAPYLTTAEMKNNFVLSCLDCHESHGSENIMLLRRRINGEDLEETIASADTMGYACKRCHTDDLAAQAGTGQTNRWEHIHHGAAEAPYAKGTCIDCHDTADGNTPIACGNCHGHGMDDSWAGDRKTGRKTF